MKTRTKESWPHWAYKNKREWKRDVRKRWNAFRKALKELRSGCAFYPSDFIATMKIEEADRVMKEWYKKS
jgi:hypothetical protein